MAFMDNMLSAAATKFGKAGCYVAPEFEKRVEGVEMPHLTLQQLFGTNVFQLHTIMEFAGPPGSGKSSLAFYMAKMFLEQSCNAVLIETENKLSPSLLRSILGDDQYERLLIWEKCTQLEIWQERMTFTISEYSKAYKKSLKEHNDAIKRREKCTRADSKAKIVVPPVEAPLLIVLDSLGGPLSQDSAKAIQADGHASKSYPVEALKNSRYFSNLPEQIRDVPITILYTNHKMLDMNADSAYGDNERSKGGATPAFFCSHRVFFREMGAVKQTRTNHYEQYMSFRCVKNALNQRGNPIRLLMEWDKSVVEGDEHQVTRFGWEEALTQFLAPDKAGYKYDREAVKQFLTVVFKTLVKYNCKELSIQESPPRVVGTAIEADNELRNTLSPYLGIKNWPVFNCANPLNSKEVTAHAEPE